MENQSKTFITIVIVVVLVLVGGMYMQSQRSVVQEPTLPEDEGVVCTMDAMQCPDGSYVGRTGPNCEFVCPE